jgi:hypothetical protein
MNHQRKIRGYCNYIYILLKKTTGGITLVTPLITKPFSSPIYGLRQFSSNTDVLLHYTHNIFMLY